RCRGIARRRRTPQHAAVSGRQPAPQPPAGRGAEGACGGRELHSGAIGTRLGLVPHALYRADPRHQPPPPARGKRCRRLAQDLGRYRGCAPPGVRARCRKRPALPGEPPRAPGDLIEISWTNPAAPPRPSRCPVVTEVSSPPDTWLEVWFSPALSAG